MTPTAIIRRLASLRSDPRKNLAPKRAGNCIVRVEILEPRTLLSATVPVQFSLPTAVYTQNFFVSITAQLNAPYTQTVGQQLSFSTGDWVYYDSSINDYSKADGSTPSSSLTFQLNGFTKDPHNAEMMQATVNIPHTDVVSGHIVMGVGSAPTVTYSVNPQTQKGGISAPTPGGANYNKIYGLFEYAMAGSLIDVDMSEVDQVGFPFNITTTPAAPPPVDLGTGITRTRIDMLNLYLEYIHDKGVTASSFKQLVQKDQTGNVIRIMAPNNHVAYAPSPVPTQTTPTQIPSGSLPANSFFAYWVTATNGYGESTAANYQIQGTAGSSDGHPVQFGSLGLSWGKIDGATGYNIYRAPATYNSVTKLYTVGTPQFLSKWTGTTSGNNATFTDNGTYTPSTRTFPATNYSYFPQNYYFNTALNQFFNYYNTKADSFFIDVPLTMKISGSDQTAIYSLRGKVVNNFSAQDAQGKWHDYIALVLTGTTTTANIQAGFPDTTGQQFAVLLPFFSTNTNMAAMPPAPKWISNPTESPGSMVFGNVSAHHCHVWA